MEITLQEVVRYLNQAQVRCTYGAVAEVLGVQSRTLLMMLQGKEPAKSWIVSARTGEPDDYREADIHSNLFLNSRVIRSADVLRNEIWVFRNSIANA